MSIGPNLQEEQFKSTLHTRFIKSVKKSTEKFFLDPLHYIFYFGLSAGLIELLIGLRPLIEYYIILAIIGAVKAYICYVGRIEVPAAGCEGHQGEPPAAHS